MVAVGFEPTNLKGTVLQTASFNLLHTLPFFYGGGIRTHNLVSFFSMCTCFLKKLSYSTIKLLRKVEYDGFEPPAVYLEGRYSIQLS
nr:MAG TPA: hypothetical protein [Caudoviricetes sp.]